MGENRGSLGGADESRVGPWALEAMPGETGFSAIAAGALSAAQAPRHPNCTTRAGFLARPCRGQSCDLLAPCQHGPHTSGAFKAGSRLKVHLTN